MHGGAVSLSLSYLTSTASVSIKTGMLVQSERRLGALAAQVRRLGVSREQEGNEKLRV